MPVAFPESRVMEIWQGSIQARTDLFTEGNEPVKIVYPGRPNDDRGADLRDAVIATGQGLLRGDIEIHVKSSSWWAHRHHEDPAYNRVILHVVYLHDAGKDTILQNGVEVPTLALHSYFEKSAERRGCPAIAPPTPCRSACRQANPLLAGKILDEAGDERFFSRMTFFRQETSKSGSGEALYQGIMTALGYSKNKEAMAELARCMPLRSLEALTSGTAPDSACLAQVQAGLMGTAGVLPSQRKIQRPTGNHTDGWVEKLEAIWKTSGKKAQMSADDWRFFKVRPGNYPVRRIAAMSCLLVRYRNKGILDGLKSILEETAGDNGRCLEESLLVSPDGYWGQYIDFGLPARGIVPALVGKERAAEIVVNVLLPFAAAHARATVQAVLEDKALNIYRHYRSPAENSLEKHMRKQLGIGSFMVDTARRRQGLLHIYKTLCTQGKCGDCPLRR